MGFRDVGRLRLFQFDSLLSDGVVHGLLTRRGGVSPWPWESLNVGAMVGDDPERVHTNRGLALEALARNPASVFDAWQVHSAEVVVANAPRGDAPPLQADAILTDRPEVTLMMRFADCVPVLLHDPVRRAVGIVHAGWLGTVRQVLRAALRRMVSAYGTRLADVVAAIGPSIAAHHYPVGAEVVAAFRAAYGATADRHLTAGDDGTRLDLWGANRQVLEEEGVRRIEVSGICSACHTEDWFSHRGEGGRTGRFAAVIALAG